MDKPFGSLNEVRGEIGKIGAEQFDLVFRGLLGHEAKFLNEYGIQVVTGEPHSLGNFAILRPGIEEEDLNTILDGFAGLPMPVAVLSTDTLSGDVQGKLGKAGFVLAGEMPVMAVDTAELSSVELLEGYGFEEVGLAKSREWAEQFAVGYDLPFGLANRFTPEAAAQQDMGAAELRFYRVEKEGVTVATSAMLYRDGVAGIYCVATVPDERGKGLGAYVTAEPLRIAREAGYGVGILQSSEAGYSVYQRLGFADFGKIPMYLRMPEG